MSIYIDVTIKTPKEKYTAISMENGKVRITRTRGEGVKEELVLNETWGIKGAVIRILIALTSLLSEPNQQ